MRRSKENILKKSGSVKVAFSVNILSMYFMLYGEKKNRVANSTSGNSCFITAASGAWVSELIFVELSRINV